MISIFHNKQPTYNPQKTNGKPYHVSRDKNGRITEGMYIGEMEPTETINNGTRLPKRILEFNQEKGLHPAQKPVALMEYLIKTYTNEGETVLDFTCGSGSTLIACRNLDRNSIGIDNWFCEKSKVVNGIQINKLKWIEIARLRLDSKI